MLAPAEHQHLHDARTRRDPTRTWKLRARMRAEVDRRWQVLGQTLRQALIEHDLVGLRGVSHIQGDKIDGFGKWIAEELRQKVLGFDGRWLRPYVQQAADAAQTYATAMIRGGGVDPDRVTAMQSLAVSELNGIVAAAQQQITRVIANCLSSGSTPHNAANAVSSVVRTMRYRTRAMVEYIVAKTHATSTLSVFRNGGVMQVGIVPEQVRRDVLQDAPQRTGPGSRSSRAETPSGRTIRRIRRAQANLEEIGSEVDVVTAGDDDVCQECQDIADGGPYDLDEAESLIPAHNWCRCAFAPAGRYANDALRDFDPDQPRDPQGRWSTWGGASHGAEVSPEQDAKVKELAERTPGLKNLLPYLAPDEVNRLNDRTIKTVVDLFSSFPVKPEEMAAVAFSGSAKRGWYEKSAKAIVDVFGVVDAPRFSALMAALSPQTGVEDNAINTLNTWTNWVRAGRPTDGDQIKDVLAKSVQGEKGAGSILPAWINNSVTALATGDPAHIVLSGPKVDSFAENLRNHVNAVTLDTWMANYLGVKQAMFARQNPVPGVSPGKGPMYTATSAVVRKAAEILTEHTGSKWTPAEIQETVWSWAKTLYEKATDDKTTVAKLLKAGSVTHGDIADTPDFASLFTRNVYRNILEMGGYGKQAAALAGGSGEPGGGHERGGSLLEAEGSGFAPDAFVRHLNRAAKRLDVVRAGRKAEEGLTDFDPDQARDPQGRWTATGGGAGYEFVSPATGQGLQLEEALAGLKSNRQRILREASEDIDAQLGLPAKHANAVGAWSDGAENSIVTTVDHDADWDKLRVAAAMEGNIADQKAVLVFKQGDGASALYSFHAGESDIAKLHENLLADGLAFHTIAPYPGGARVYVADLDGSAHDAVAKAAERYHAGVDYQIGRAEFIGTTKQDGTDREQRDDARRAYEKVIRESAVPRSQDIWSRVHHHWGQALGVTLDRGFDPAEPRDPAGRWTEGGGAFSDDEHARAIKGVIGERFELSHDVPHFAGLSVGEANTVAEYSDSKAFLPMNHALRDGTATPAQRDFAEKLNSALDRMPNFGGTTYRVGSNKPEVLSDYQGMVGKTIRERGFVSTAREDSTYLASGRRLVNFMIKGKTGKDISRIAKERDEKEVLFKSGTVFKVASVEQAADGKYDVTLQER